MKKYKMRELKWTEDDANAFYFAWKIMFFLRRYCTLKVELSNRVKYFGKRLMSVLTSSIQAEKLDQ
jgi:hypothetical protein